MSIDENFVAEAQPARVAGLPDRLRRRDASRYLREQHGIEMAEATFAKKAVTGGGPEYETFGRIPYYRPAKLDEWVAAQMKRRRSTSDRGEAELHQT